MSIMCSVSRKQHTFARALLYAVWQLFSFRIHLRAIPPASVHYLAKTVPSSAARQSAARPNGASGSGNGSRVKWGLRTPKKQQQKREEQQEQRQHWQQLPSHFNPSQTQALTPFQRYNSLSG